MSTLHFIIDRVMAFRCRVMAGPEVNSTYSASQALIVYVVAGWRLLNQSGMTCLLLT